jgi:hypothetical protein
MIKIRLSCFIFISVVISACNKSQNDAQIDVSKQDQVDYNGNLISSWLNDGQWESKVFTTQEQNLFNGLDTANVTGTLMPDSVSVSSSFFFPNPFTTIASLMFTFSGGYNGQVELKYVIVDNHMNIKNMGAYRVQATADQSMPSAPSVSNFIHLSPNLPVGQYRIYLTLSTDVKRNFYMTWGNIQRSS